MEPNCNRTHQLRTQFLIYGKLSEQNMTDPTELNFQASLTKLNFMSFYHYCCITFDSIYDNICCVIQPIGCNTIKLIHSFNFNSKSVTWLKHAEPKLSMWVWFPSVRTSFIAVFHLNRGWLGTPVFWEEIDPRVLWLKSLASLLIYVTPALWYYAFKLMLLKLFYYRNQFLNSKKSISFNYWIFVHHLLPEFITSHSMTCDIVMRTNTYLCVLKG